MRNIDSKSRPRTQFRFKYLAVRIRLLRLGGSLTTFSTVSVKSGHFAVQSPCPLYPRKRTLVSAFFGNLGAAILILERPGPTDILASHRRDQTGAVETDRVAFQMTSKDVYGR